MVGVFRPDGWRRGRGARLPLGGAVNQSATYHVVRRSTPGSTGNETISVPFNPTAVMVTYAGGVSVPNTAVDHVCNGIGFSDGSAQYADGTWDEDNVSTTNPYRYNSDQQVVYVGVGSAADAKCEAVGSGLGPGTGQWVFNWSAVPATPGMVTYEFFSCPAQAGTRGLGNGTSELQTSTIGMVPDVLIMSQVCWNNPPSNPTGLGDRMFRSFGIAINKTGTIVQRGICTSSVTSATNQTLTSIGWTDRITGQVNNDAENYSLEVTELGDFERFRVTPRAGTDANASFDYVGYLCLETDTASAYLGTITLPTSTSLWTVTDPGFQPVGAKIFGASIESADLDVVQTLSPETDSVFAAATDGYTGGGFWQGDLDDFNPGVTDTNTGAPSGLLTYADSGGNIEYNIPLPTWTANGWTVTPNTAAATPTRVAFVFAIGEASTNYDAKLTAASFSFTANSFDVQQDSAQVLTAASFSFTANALALEEGYVAGLTAGAFSFTANAIDVQAKAQTTLVAASFSFTPHALDVQAAEALVLTAATFNFTANALNLQAPDVVELGAAVFSFNAHTIGLPGTGAGSGLGLTQPLTVGSLTQPLTDGGGAV